jgi:hypothetical protein
MRWREWRTGGLPWQDLPGYPLLLIS